MRKHDKMISIVGWAMRNARSKFIHYKIVHQYYFTSLKLFKMGLIKGKKCWKCNKEEGTFFHAIWDCSRVTTESPQLHSCQLLSPIPSSLCKAELRLILTGCMVGATIILRNWKNSCKPDFAECFKLLTETVAFENMIAR